MIEKPDFSEQSIISRLREEYGIFAARVVFLPLGVDVNSAVYRVETEDKSTYFLKIRTGEFDEMAVAIPQFLRSQGIQAVIAPVMTEEGQLWGNMGANKMILYPFIQGKDGYEIALTGQNWIDLGRALKKVHTAQVPAVLAQFIRRETFSPVWREMVKSYQEQAENTNFEDPAAAKLAAFLQANRDQITEMIERAERLGNDLKARLLEFVLCHSDIHPGNFLIRANQPDAIYIVDWDAPIFAPKERDLMSIGAGMSGDWPGGREESLFYQGYGFTQVDPAALAYYRFERIIQDIAEFCKQLFSTSEGGEDREQAYRYLTGSFLPGQVVEIAFKTGNLIPKNTL
jgi:spectinomycin phosphotransferase